MEDQNIIIFLDKIQKLLELGNKQKSIDEITTLILELEHKISKQKGKLFQPIIISQDEKDTPIKLMQFKVNEIINFLNERFQR